MWEGVVIVDGMRDVAVNDKDVGDVAVVDIVDMARRHRRRR